MRLTQSLIVPRIFVRKRPEVPPIMHALFECQFGTRDTGEIVYIFSFAMKLTTSTSLLALFAIGTLVRLQQAREALGSRNPPKPQTTTLAKCSHQNLNLI